MKDFQLKKFDSFEELKSNNLSIENSTIKNIVELLKQQGMFAQEIRTRLQNKQITLNGEALDKNSEIEFSEFIDAGEFIFNEIILNQKLKTLSHIVGFENLFGSNLGVLQNHSILKLSKKEILILKH